MADTILIDDPIDILLGEDGDIDLSSGGPQFSRGIDAVLQAIKIALQAVRGEWFADLEDGVPYFERDGVTADQALLGQQFDRGKAQAAFRDAILSAPGVGSIVSLVVTFESVTRTLSVSFEVKTIFGDTVADSLNVSP